MKRFFTQATVGENNAILLDGKAVQTPAKNPLCLPNSALAQAVAEEWNAQGEVVDKSALPLTGMASLAIDIAAPRRAELIAELLEYGETDLLFYRSEDEELAQQQRRLWQPWINHVQVELHTRYATTQSILPAAQPVENAQAHQAALEVLDAWQLALLAAVVKPTTSLLLGWLFVQKKLDAQELFTVSQLEEAHNAAKWGQDDEAQKRSDSIRKDLAVAQHWRDLL